MKKLAIGWGAFLVLVMTASGCGSNDSTVKIALLLPEDEMSRYESADRPNFEKRLEEICDHCEAIYRNAKQDFSRQRSQAEAVLRRGVDAIVFDPLASEHGSAIIKKAHARNVPVLDYDTLIANSEPDVFVSFDVVREGELMAESLSKRLAEINKPNGPIVMINGEPGNLDQPRFEEGAETGFAAAGVAVVRRDYTPFWEPSAARVEMRLAIDALGTQGFTGVYAETDGVAEGVIAAMEAAGIDPADRPTTGRDATVLGLRRIIGGQQFMTVYEPIEHEASMSAEIALMLAEGKAVPAEEITDRVGEGDIHVPSILLEPVVVTKDNLRETVLADGTVSVSKLCAGAFRSECEANGIRG